MTTNLRLTYQNNWEADSYFVENRRIQSLEAVSIDGKEYNVTEHVISVPYSDMGQTYFGTSTHYFIRETVFGITKEFDLNTIVNKKKIIPVRYTVYD